MVRHRSLVLAALVLLSFGTATEALSDEKYYGAGAHTGLREELGYEPRTTAEQLKSLHLNSFRDDVTWYRYAPQGSDLLGPTLRRLNTLLDARTGTPLLILNGGNPAVPDSNPPRTDAARQAFGEFARGVATATRKYEPIYEVWNEWDLKWRRRAPDGPMLQTVNDDYSPENYVKLAEQAYRNIKQATNAKVLVGAIGGDPDWTWTRRAIRAGLLNHADGISFHVYNHCERTSARSAENAIKKTETFRHVVQNASGKQDMKVYVTEVGWPSFDGKCSVPEDVAASNLAQYILWSAATPWVGGVWIYELKNSGNKPSEREHSFGVYDHGNSPKGRTCIVQEAFKLARDASEARFASAAEGVRWIKAKSTAGSEMWVVWTTELGAVRQVRISEEPTALKARPLCGETADLAPGEWISVGNVPVTVELASSRGASLSVRDAD